MGNLVVYAEDTSDLPKIAGVVHANPRHFTRVRPDHTSAVIVGEWPQIVRAYERAEIPVRVVSCIADVHLGEGTSASGPLGGRSDEVPELSREDILALPWNELRRHTMARTGLTPVNKQQAYEMLGVSDEEGDDGEEEEGKEEEGVEESDD